MKRSFAEISDSKIEKDETLQLLLIFGRIADHLAVGNCEYSADTEVPFSLWCTSRFSRRLKNNHPNWEALFRSSSSSDESSQSVSRTDFVQRLAKMPFKYPLDRNGRPAAPPESLSTYLASLNSSKSEGKAEDFSFVAEIRRDSDLRSAVNEWLQSLPIQVSCVRLQWT